MPSTKHRYRKPSRVAAIAELAIATAIILYSIAYWSNLRYHYSTGAADFYCLERLSQIVFRPVTMTRQAIGAHEPQIVVYWKPNSGEIVNRYPANEIAGK